MALGPLSDAAVGTVVRSVLSPGAEDAFCRACAGVTGGNPFLLHEALTQIRLDGIPPVAAAVDRVDRLRPETVVRSVLTRVGRLGPDAVRLVRAVSVLGTSADLRRTALLADLDVDRAAELVDALVHESVLTSGSPIELVHPLVRTAVSADIPDSLRAVSHKRAARLLAADGASPEQLAPHLLVTAPAGEPWVVEMLQAAATAAVARGAPEPAADYLARARAEPPEPERRSAVLLAQGHVLAMLTRSPEAIDALAEVFETADDPGIRAHAGVELATLLVLTDRAADATTVLARLAEAGTDDRDLQLRRLSILAFGGMYAMEPPASWTGELDQVAATLTGARPEEQVILAALAFGAAAAGDRPADEVARIATRAASGPLPEPDPRVLVNAASAALAIAGRGPAAVDLLDRGLDRARACGDVTAFCYLSMLRSHTVIVTGQLDEAEADARTALDLAADAQHAVLAAAVLVDALVERGQLDDAERVLAGQQLTGQLPMTSLLTHFVLMARGRLRLAQGRPAEALTDLLHLGEALAGSGYVNPAFAPWRTLAATAHLVLDQVDAARALAAEDLDRARRFGAPRALGMALRVAGLVEGGDAGLAHLREAAEVLADAGDGVEHARALVELGSALRRAGQRRAAVGPLRPALDLATRCGARPLADRAREELVAAGARPRRHSLTGPDALTPGELRVARRAAAKETNREIAQALFISRRTVEIHLTNVYRKLAIDSRHQLATVLNAT